MSEIRESILNVRAALASNPDAGPAPDRPAIAVIEDGLRCRADGGDGWSVVTDMPAAVGGGSAAPTPGWLIRAALASCAATTIAMRAAELDVALTRLEVTAESETDMRGLLAAGDGVDPGPASARLRVRLAADGADEARLDELVEWADSHSPVGDCVRRAVPVEVEIEASVAGVWATAQRASATDIDVALLKSEIKKTYATVSTEPERDYVFPNGRPWAEDLAYPDELANVPEAAVESFAGVANPFSLGRLEAGARVLDLGSGAGTDSLVAAQMVGVEGSVTGIDMTPEMLGKARAAAAEMGAANVEFVEGEAERLPFPDESFDIVISNGVIDLIPDKDAVFAELFRVLAPGGRIQVADVTIQRPVSEEGRRNIDLWTGWIAGALLEAAYARLLEGHGFERIETGQLVDTYARSAFEDTREKAQRYGARGTTVRAYKPR